MEHDDILWDFIKNVSKEVKESGDKSKVIDIFDRYSLEDKKLLYEAYDLIDTKLYNLLCDCADEYEEENPSFYISEDGMMDLVPYLISLGQNKVNLFYQNPKLAFKIADEPWEYPFDLHRVLFDFSLKYL